VVGNRPKTERDAKLRQNGFCVSVADTRECARHGHNFLEFSYIECGKMEHSFGGAAQMLKAGDYFIVDYGTKHSYRAVGEEPLRVINLLFYPAFVDRTLGEGDSFEKVVNSYLIRFRYRSLNHSPAGIAFRDESGAIYAILRHILEEYKRGDAGYMEYIRCLVVEMLILIMRGIGGSDTKARESEVISAITRRIKQEYAGHLRLSEFAEEYSYSLSHLSKKFSEETGLSFMEYLQRIRIEQACKLLEGESGGIAHIAESVGYTDIKFFNKVFKETLGLTPTAFRKLHKG